MAIGPLTTQEYNHYLNSWCKSQGIKYRDFEQHPYFDDVMLLVQFRNNLWDQMTKSEQAIWNVYWGFVYHQKYPLKEKAIKKFEAIAQDIIIKQQAIRKARQIIKTKRTKALS